MIKLLVPILLVLLIIAGCIPVVPSKPVTPNEPPVAYMDSVSASTVTQGQTVSFRGHGTDAGGTVVGYSWRSDRDGVISKDASFSSATLSLGNHYIYFKVQDNLGEWSKEVMSIVNVLSPGTVKPSVNSFKATPAVILDGGSTTLTWDIADAITIEILPDIGNVSAIGSRLVSPRTTMTYKLTAANSAGFATAETTVIISTASVKTVELFSIVGEEGYIDRNGEIGSSPKAGITQSAVPMQAFFSFDISMIPSSAIITSASLDLTNHIVYGSPAGFLGAFGIFQTQYDVLRSRDYIIAFPSQALVTAYSEPTQLYTYARITDAIQQQVITRNNRFQIRAQFERYAYNASALGANLFEFTSGKAKLVISYK